MPNLKDIAIRASSGAVFVALLVVSTLLSKLAIAGVLAVMAFIGIQEVLSMMNRNGKISSRLATITSAALLFIGFALSVSANDSRYLIPALALAFLFPFIHQVVYADKPSFQSAIISAGIPLYVGFPLILLVEAANFGDYFQPWLLLGILVLTWSYDTFAYLVGSWIGKTRLLAHVSPKKSLEGLAGGAIAAMTTAWIYAQFNNDISFYHWLALSLIVVVFGTLGDLTESILKRNFSAKDSGSIMPGHGGMLDRFDALLFIGPAAYAYLLFAVN